MEWALNCVARCEEIKIVNLTLLSTFDIVLHIRIYVVFASLHMQTQH